MNLTQDQIDRFDREGYMHVGRVLDDDTLARAREAYDRIVAGDDRPESFRDLGLKEGQDEAVTSVFQVIDMWRLDKTFEAIVKDGFDRDTVSRVAAMVDRNEYKRKQAAVGLKVTTRAFGTGRRMPIAAKFHA